MNGFLIINKSPGMSSYDVIRRLKKICKFKKIGYIGTLDRNATGVLPVALNEGVKMIPYLEDGEKVYRAKFLLGVTTDTFDVEGTRLSESNPDPFPPGLITEYLMAYKGKITQKIPAYSSKKVNRRPMYKWTREGIPVEPQMKEVEVYDIRLLEYAHPYVDIEVTCSKGTYIRSLADDFGQKLACGATLFSLNRTRHGEFTEEMSQNIECFKIEEDLLQYLLPLERVLRSAKDIVIEPAIEKFLKHGMPIPLFGNSKDWSHNDLAKILNKNGQLIGIGGVDMISKTIKVKRLIIQ